MTTVRLMSSVTRPRGPLPARVYWVRRAVTLGLVLAVFLGVARLLGAASDGRDPGAGSDAVQAGALTDESDTAAAQESGSPSASGSRASAPVRPGTNPSPGASAGTLPAPDGPCVPAEVVVTPVVETAIGGAPVVIRLEVTSRASRACTFTVAPETVLVKVVSGLDLIWSTQQCPRRMPRLQVVARRLVPAVVNVIWSGRRSDPECSRGLAYALPGYYHAIAAALGGRPTDLQFRLLSAPTATVTRTIEPSPSPSTSARPPSSPAPRVGSPAPSATSGRTPAGAVLPGDPR